MKLYDLINALSASDTPHEYTEDFKLIDAQTSLNDKAILLSTIEREIDKKNYKIVDCEPSENISPTQKEIKSYLSYIVDRHPRLLSEVLNQLTLLLEKQNIAKEASHFKEHILNQYKDRVTEKFKYDKIDIDLVGYGYESALSAGFKYLKNGLRLKILGEVEGNLTDIKGWKFHISLDDSDEKRENISKAWNLIIDLIYKYQIAVTKVVTNEVNQADYKKIIGKQITIYANQSIDPNFWTYFFKEIHDKFVTNNIKPGFTAEGNRQIAGSEFISYRFDTTFNNGRKGTDRREGGNYKPDGLVDPFENIMINVLGQNKNKGKASEQLPSERKIKPEVPSLNLSVLRK